MVKTFGGVMVLTEEIPVVKLNIMLQLRGFFERFERIVFWYHAIACTSGIEEAEVAKISASISSETGISA